MDTRNRQDATGANPEDNSAEDVQHDSTGAADEATAGEANKEEGAAAEADQTEEDKKKHNRQNAQRRLEQRRNRDIELENARLRGMLEGMKQSGGKTETTTTDTDQAEAEFSRKNPKPTADQFQSPAEFQEALTDWKMDLRDFKRDFSTRKTQETEAQRTFSERMETQRTKGEEKYEDFAELVSAIDFEPATMRAIVASEQGEDIAYYLASNPQEYERIGKLSPFLQAKEIGRIEAQLESGKIQIKTITQAPPPPSTVGGRGNAGKKSIFDENLSTADRIALSKASKAAAGRGQ